MKEAFPNATTMFKHILVCQKRPADVLLCLLFFVQILVAATQEQDKEPESCVPLVIAPGRQEDTLRLLFLYP